MEAEEIKNSQEAVESAPEEERLEGGAYEVLRKRLAALDGDLCERLEKLNTHRKDVFGGNENKLLGNERIQTENNCVPRDIISLGDLLLFGYNVFLGLRSATKLGDVFSLHRFDGSSFQELKIETLLGDAKFGRDFQEVYKYYKNVRFLQFIKSVSKLLLVFQVGESIADIKVFQFKIKADASIEYIDDRGDMEYKFPPQHDFEWTITTRDDQVTGLHPHISIKDHLFVECVGGDFTIKVENNTESGEGIYSEPVENPDQTLDDALIYYAFVGELILLKVRPYREEKFRYFVYNEKRQSVTRIDSIEQACVQLPEDHGFIFPRGYYLRSGETRQFDEDVEGMRYLECVASPNGEDYLYVFYHEEQGLHILLHYNLITKDLTNPIFCHGYSLYDDGKMVLFNSPTEEPKRTHAMQIWQTPFYSDTFETRPTVESYLTKVGNRDLVKGISDGYAVSRLIMSNEISLFIYNDIIKVTTNMMDAYYWLGHDEAFKLKEVVQSIKDAAIAAVDEYEKVVRIRKNTETRLRENQDGVKKCLLDYAPDNMRVVDEFVEALNEIRSRRGQVISLRELRYVDLSKVEKMDTDLAEAYENVSRACVEVLLRDDALTPYINANQEIVGDLDKIEKVSDLKPLHERLETLAQSLDLLTDVVNNLEIEDATKTTRIVDSITDVYALVNRTRANLKNARTQLGKTEAKAEFGAQFKLLTQSITNYISMCDTPEKCDELLTKIMVNIEELEGRFSDYDEYTVQLAEKREEAYAAFTGRKQVLDEEKKRRVTSLLSSADRILKGITGRAESFKDVDEVNSYFASDLMIAKLRDIIEKLRAVGDTVQADDLSGRLKTTRDEILRRLRDKLDLFEEGANVIKFGDYKFSVNTQPLELTTVYRDENMFFHLTGTDFHIPIEDEEFLKTKPLWRQVLVSEDARVYRAEYLAYKMLMSAVAGEAELSLPLLREIMADQENKVKRFEDLARDYSSSLYNEGYEKGVHDHDAAKILAAIFDLYETCKLLRYDSTSRAHAIIFWAYYEDREVKEALRSRLRSYGAMSGIFETDSIRVEYVDELKGLINSFYEKQDWGIEASIAGNAAEYLYFELQDQEELVFTINALAHDLHKRFASCLKSKKVDAKFYQTLQAIPSVKGKLELAMDWVSNFVAKQGGENETFLVHEVMALLLCDSHLKNAPRGAKSEKETHSSADSFSVEITQVGTFVTVDDLLGQHPLIKDKSLDIYFDRFLLKMRHFTEIQVPLFEKYVRLRTELTEKERESLRLSEFKPKVMGSFVRNKLINDVYLNLVGANFAKQMGVVGEKKRTDLMGLLLLISPPGYGKTTLMEYISNRLGLTFMKINGPAIGHQVTSLDPIEAPNATSREELQKLNLSFEMGNNVMIYLDDIQHLNPELLQKFISLCDAQRKIEGVFRNKTRTYDLRGKKVCVVMAGNPYTESGDKFKIPDMLANRADTYNLGDIGSSSTESFNLSFLENAITSNPTLSVISTHSHEDFYRFVDVVKRGSAEGIDFNYSYSAAEVNEITTVMKKLFRIRDIVLSVNKQYIYSAAQQDDYRTEPSFKLQGSYRNMNRMAEKVYPVMTAEEVDQLIIDHYYNEAQTLTSGAESNFLKFKEIMGIMNQDDTERWEKIKSEFNRRQTLAGIDDSDEFGKVIAQLSAFNAGVDNLRLSVDKGFDRGLTEIAAAINKSSEGEKVKIDLKPLIEVLSEMSKAQSKSSEPERIDLTPLTTAVAKLADKKTSVKVENSFPKEYGIAWERQAVAVESLLPMINALCEYSENYSKIESVLDNLLKGKISIQLNK